MVRSVPDLEKKKKEALAAKAAKSKRGKRKVVEVNEGDTDEQSDSDFEELNEGDVAEVDIVGKHSMGGAGKGPKDTESRQLFGSDSDEDEQHKTPPKAQPQSRCASSSHTVFPNNNPVKTKSSGRKVKHTSSNSSGSVGGDSSAAAASPRPGSSGDHLCASINTDIHFWLGFLFGIFFFFKFFASINAGTLPKLFIFFVCCVQVVQPPVRPQRSR